MVDLLRALGHDEAPAGRSVGTDGARVDPFDPIGHRALDELARSHDAVANASGIEEPGLAYVASAALFVDISATAAWLEALGAAAPRGARNPAGSGLAPGLSTNLLIALDARAQLRLDLAVVLGGGETHESAAVVWTAALAGQPMYAPPEGGDVRNFREIRRLPGGFGVRRHLRADFPDQLLIGAPRQFRSTPTSPSRADRRRPRWALSDGFRSSGASRVALPTWAEKVGRGPHSIDVRGKRSRRADEASPRRRALSPLGSPITPCASTSPAWRPLLTSSGWTTCGACRASKWRERACLVLELIAVNGSPPRFHVPRRSR